MESEGAGWSQKRQAKVGRGRMEPEEAGWSRERQDGVRRGRMESEEAGWSWQRQDGELLGRKTEPLRKRRYEWIGASGFDSLNRMLPKGAGKERKLRKCG
jgi:hypothetical protein